MIRLLGLATLFAGLIVGGGVLGFWLYARLVIGLTLSEQAGLATLPPVLPVIAEAQNDITIQLDGYIDATVPFQQVLDLPVVGSYTADVKLDTEVPVRMTIRYQGVVPVDTFADIEGTTDFNYQDVKRFRNVKFKAKVPLKFLQPVTFVVPVDTTLRLQYEGPLQLALDQTLRAPVDTVLQTRLRAVREVITPILARFAMKVYVPQTPQAVVIDHADLRFPLRDLRLTRKAAAGASP